MNMNLLGIIFQVVGSVTLLYSYIPQIIKLYKTKKSQDISLAFWIILTIGLFCIAFNMVISHVPMFIIFTQFLNAIFALWVLILVKNYK